MEATLYADRMSAENVAFEMRLITYQSSATSHIKNAPFPSSLFVAYNEYQIDGIAVKTIERAHL